MILKKTIHFVFFTAVFFLTILSADPECGESVFVLKNKKLSYKSYRNNIPWGVYTYNYKSLYVKDAGHNQGRLILKNRLSLNIKSSWSDISDNITFIQVPLADLLRKFENWTPAVCVIRSDGSSFKQLTGGKFGDFNPTWIRGSEEIVFTRLDLSKKHYGIFVTSPELFPGREVPVSDPKFNESCCTSVYDGRLLVQSDRSGTNEFYLLEIARNRDGTASGQTGKYLKIKAEVPEPWSKKRIVRESVSPDSTKLVFEYSENVWDMKKSVIYYANFHVNNRHPKISNARPILPPGVEKSCVTIYPKWNAKGDAILFISDQSGKYQIYKYTISTGTTKRLSPNDDADYTYFCQKNLPN